jgi:hypothetical protein
MSQRTLWEWENERADGSVPPDPEVRTRGSLDCSRLPERESAMVAEAHELHWRLESHLGVVDLVVTDNRRRMLTTRASEERRRIRIHHMFLGCGPETVTAIVQLATGDDRAREHIKEYIESNREAIRFQPDQDELDQEGQHFDLVDMLRRARSHLPDHDLDDIQITWGREGRGSKSIRFGSYDFDQKLVRIHPALDREWVPEYFVEFIVYHELLHAVCPPVENEESRRVHTSEFLELEQQFPDYEKAVEWESQNLRRILDRKGTN